MDIGPHLLGRTVEHDPRNRDYPFPVRKIVKPVSRLWSCDAPILDQGDIGSCEGNTAVEWLNSGVNQSNRRAYNLKQMSLRNPTLDRGVGSSRYLIEKDAVTMYSKATQLDDDGIPGFYPQEDTGTSAVGIAKSMKEYGAITAYQWTFGWEHFIAAIDHGPVMLGTNWTMGMFDPDRNGYVEDTGEWAGEHAYLGRGIDYKNQRVRCRNHWTSQWGAKGDFYLRFATLQRLLADQGDVLVPVRIV